MQEMLDLDDKIIETTINTSKEIKESPGTFHWIFMFAIMVLPFFYTNFFRWCY